MAELVIGVRTNCPRHWWQKTEYKYLKGFDRVGFAELTNDIKKAHIYGNEGICGSSYAGCILDDMDVVRTQLGYPTFIENLTPK